MHQEHRVVAYKPISIRYIEMSRFGSCIHEHRGYGVFPGSPRWESIHSRRVELKEVNLVRLRARWPGFILAAASPGPRVTSVSGATLDVSSFIDL